MSDPFADLWNTSAPLPAKPKPQTLSATKKDNSDAFADLLSGSTITTRSANAEMTLGARLAMEAEENNKRHHTTTSGVQSHKSPDGAWVGLDWLEGGISHPKTNVKVDDDDDWGFGSVAQSSSVSIQQTSINPKPSAFTPTTKPPSTSETLWDLDDDDNDHLMSGVDHGRPLCKPIEAVITKKKSDFGTSRTSATPSRPISDQADKFLLQASEIGLSVLSRASAFWKEGKEKVVKVMEERAGFEERANRKNTDGRPRMDGRPKWMKEVMNDEDAGVEFGEEYGEGFKDPGPSGSFGSAYPRTLPTASSSTLSLASTHKNTGTSQFKLGQYGPSSDSYTSAITLLPPGHLLLVPLYTNRSLTRLRCGEYVAAGEDAGEALKIICVADPNANTNLSIGTEDGNVIWNPDRELPELIQGGREKVNEGGWSDSRGVGVDLVDGYIKALRRRAEAWEGREKWVEAGKDWEVLAGGGGGAGGGWIGEGIRKEAVRGAGRCRRMASGQEGSSSSSLSSSSASKPPLSKAKLRSSPRPSSQPSKALLAHQATTLQADADETLKHQLKDSVDARVSAWKDGKEMNIRALLASLDMVLWDDILMKGGGVKVTELGGLVTGVQVKKEYVRAISKVHPDKLNPSNSTVEQRMLANSVFAALNEAWISFQGGNG